MSSCHTSIRVIYVNIARQYTHTHTNTRVDPHGRQNPTVEPATVRFGCAMHVLCMHVDVRACDAPSAWRAIEYDIAASNGAACIACFSIPLLLSFLRSFVRSFGVLLVPQVVPFFPIVQRCALLLFFFLAFPHFSSCKRMHRLHGAACMHNMHCMYMYKIPLVVM